MVGLEHIGSAKRSSNMHQNCQSTNNGVGEGKKEGPGWHMNREGGWFLSTSLLVAYNLYFTRINLNTTITLLF